jgi:peroxiredoxin
VEHVLFVLNTVLLGLILVSLWAVLYHLVKQQGRLVLRTDMLENRLGFVNKAEMPNMHQGLAMGLAFPSVHLSDLAGKMIKLEDFHGKQVLLVHWAPNCGYCIRIAPELAALQIDLAKRNVQLVFASHGDAELNRKLAEEHGLKCPILRQDGDANSIEAFEHLGTPVAYLLNEEGRVAAPLAVGADRVIALVRKAVGVSSKGRRLPGERPLAESRIEREGLKAGTHAPSFRLPDIYGRTVSLEDYKGGRVLLIFSDPRCGPCEQLASHLSRPHRQRIGENVAVIMVGRGDPEENRRKAQEYGFDFPIVLQQKWEISKQYGIFATPVAFLIDEHGVIARKVAKGPDEIFGLIEGEELARR